MCCCLPVDPSLNIEYGQHMATALRHFTICNFQGTAKVWGLTPSWHCRCLVLLDLAFVVFVTSQDLKVCVLCYWSFRSIKTWPALGCWAKRAGGQAWCAAWHPCCLLLAVILAKCHSDICEFGDTQRSQGGAFRMSRIYHVF